MENETRSRIRLLLDRLQRLIASEDWADDLNPAQRSALTYLARANRFSRSPSHVADYLCTTRGTASQTLKALEKKGLIERARSSSDGRAVTYELTNAGVEATQQTSAIDDALSRTGPESGMVLERALRELITHQLELRNFRSFGLCRTCAHHTVNDQGSYCALLRVDLRAEEAHQLCHEHSVA